MRYDFKCKNCNKIQEVRIAVSDDKLLDKLNQTRTCDCGGKMIRVFGYMDFNLNFIYTQEYARQQLLDIKNGD